MFNTLDIIVHGIMEEYLSVPRVIVFPGIPVIIKDIYDPVDPDDTRTLYVPLSIEEMVDGVARDAERYGYTTYEDEEVDPFY